MSIMSNLDILEAELVRLKTENKKAANHIKRLYKILNRFSKNLTKEEIDTAVEASYLAFDMLVRLE